jgi:16S rRNA (guanine527-N7)-methyltransferase
VTSSAARLQARSGLEERLESGLSELGIPAGPGLLARLVQYVVLLEKWNRVYNLTAIRDAEKVVSVHLLDCLAVIPYLRGNRVLDVGSGAGLPGIPVALARPDIRVTLLDSSHKKAAFLRQAVAELQLKNAAVVCERAESWQPSERFDCVISRAFAELSEFVRLTEHLLARGGLLAAMKGVHPYEEIEQLPREFRVTEVRRLFVPGLEAERHLVLIERP